MTNENGTAQESTGNEFVRVVEILWRRRFVILVPFLIIAISVTLWGLYIPNVYRSSTSIFIEPQKVPTAYVRSTITSDMESRLRTVTQQITSRTKLLKVISELDLYPQEKAKGRPGEVLVDIMRKNLEVEIPRVQTRGQEPNFFQVHFQHNDPTKAMLAVSRLVSLFIEDSLQVRELQAAGTTSFIEEELSKLKSVLETQEQAIQEYKSRYMGELPNQLDANLRMLDNLQMQLANNQESQRGVEDRILTLEQEISRLEGDLKVAGSASLEAGTTTVSDATLNQLIQQRDALTQRISSMEGIYTNRHPDLVAAKRELVRIEDTLRTASQSLTTSGREGPKVAQSLPTYSTELTNLRRQLNDNKPNLTSLKEEETNLRKQIEEYKNRVESAPVREQHILKLTRDYENTKARYDDLLNKKMEAQLSENLEKRQKGENFTILDPANFPEEPFRPNRLQIIGIGFGSGLGFGLGLAMILEFLAPAFHSVSQVKPLTSAPLTLAIPYFETDSERRQRRKRLAVGTGAAVLGFILVLLIFHLFVVDLGEMARTIATNVKTLGSTLTLGGTM